jgi:hypothetical protein
LRKSDSHLVTALFQILPANLRTPHLLSHPHHIPPPRPPHLHHTVPRWCSSDLGHLKSEWAPLHATLPHPSPVSDPPTPAPYPSVTRLQPPTPAPWRPNGVHHRSNPAADLHHRGRKRRRANHGSPTGSSPWFFRGVSSDVRYSVHLCLGVRGGPAWRL